MSKKPEKMLRSMYREKIVIKLGMHVNSGNSSTLLDLRPELM